MPTFEQLQESAKNFLDIADKNNEEVTAYTLGSKELKDERAYNEVKSAERIFIEKYNQYYDEQHKPALDYSLAESVLETN